MSIVPAHKQDFQACELLAVAADDQVVPRIRELLEWIQDMNWPVAGRVVQRLTTVGAPLTEPVEHILVGSDDIWKYWVINSLLPGVDPNVVESLRPHLQRIVSSPTANETAEDVVEGAARLLELINQ
jgi:hypothetical protein